jgi:hypothetical protein
MEEGKKMYILVESIKYDSRKYTYYILNYVLKDITFFTKLYTKIVSISVV